MYATDGKVGCTPCRDVNNLGVRASRGVNISTQCNCNYILSYSPSCLGQETAKGPFGLRVKLPPAHLSTTHDGGFTLSL